MEVVGLWQTSILTKAGTPKKMCAGEAYGK